MTVWNPGSKGVATRTAKMLDAWAADLAMAAEGLRTAAGLYRAGEYSNGRQIGIGAIKNYLGAVMRSYRGTSGRHE